MAVRVVGVGGLLLATAAAAEPAAPTPAPPERSWYGTATPAAPDEQPHVRHVVQRGGLFVLGGATYVDGAMSARLDLGLPIPIAHAPRLRLVLVAEGNYETQPLMIERRTLALTPTAQYAWHLPLELKHGELLLIAGAGMRRTTLWIERPDEPFWPSKWESQDRWALRLSAGLEYRGSRGLIVSVQPVSVGLPITDPEAPDPRWMEPKPKTDVGASLVAGYQFR